MIRNRTILIFFLLTNILSCGSQQNNNQNVVIKNEIKIDKEIAKAINEQTEPLEKSKVNDSFSTIDPTKQELSHESSNKINLKNKIIFSFGGSTNHKIYLSDIDGLNRVKILPNDDKLSLENKLTLNTDNRNPTISPDGTKIAFNGYEGLGMYIMNIDGSNLTQISEYGKNPCWSPDGTKIIYNLSFGGQDIFSVNSNGLKNTKLTDSQKAYVTPNYSPNGSKIAFSDYKEIYLMNNDGTKITKLTDGTPLNGYFSPVWSPDGTKIGFLSILKKGIFVVNADGSNFEEVYKPTDTFSTIQSFDWSPDGTKIIFSLENNDISDLFIMSLDGSELKQITKANRGEEYVDPKWSKTK